MVILDTDILISLLRGTSKASERVRSLEESGQTLFTTIIAAYELLKGAQISAKPQENVAKVQDSISSLRVLELSLAACEEASKIYKELKEKGELIGEFDVLIAAIARSHGELLVTRDEHFKLIKGIKTMRW